MLPIFKSYRSAKVISVYITGHGCKRISRDEFENWLEWTDRLDWIGDVVPDETGEPAIPDSGTMSLNEYWDLPSDHINKDLSTYITFNFPEFYDMGTAIAKVLQQVKINDIKKAI